MAKESSFESSYEGIGEMLRSDFMLMAMAERAEKVASRAEELAHVSPIGSKLSPSGAYKKSFHVRLSKRGGKQKNRAEARVVSDDPIAYYVEHGTVNMSGEHVMLRAIIEGLAE
jgi:hypothetical protein